MDIRFFAWASPLSVNPLTEEDKEVLRVNRIKMCAAAHKHSYCCKADAGHWFCPNCGETEPKD